MDFPTTPTVGQVYALGTRSWVWNGTGWARSDAGGGAWFEIDFVYVELAEFPSSEPEPWYELAYV